MTSDSSKSLDELLKPLVEDPKYHGLADQIKTLFLQVQKARDPLGLNIEPDNDGFAFAGRLIETGTMTAAFFHEINQPLLGIKGFAELIRDKCSGPSESKIKEWAEEIRRQVGTVILMQRKISAHMRPGDDASTRACLQQCVDEAIGLFEHRIIKKRVSIHLDLHEDIPELQIPRMHLIQILVNLVANALDALDQVKDLSNRRMGIVVLGQREQFIRILVADTGPGIPPDRQTKLFVPFNTTKENRGSGLGLVISKRLAQNAGGDLSLLPETDKAHGDWSGAVFVIKLPTTSNHQQGKSEEPQLSKSDTNRRLAQLELDLVRFGRQLKVSRRVLIADNNSPEQLELIETLAQHSILADMVTSAEEALEKLSQRSYAALITDMLLPDISGMDLITRAHEVSSDLEVLVCTDSQSIDTAIEALERGASDYIPRPYPSRPFLSWKVKGALARFDFETRTNSVIRFLKERSEKLASEKGKDILTSCAIPLKKALESYQNKKEQAAIGILGNKVLVRAASSLGYDIMQVGDENSAIEAIKDGKIQVLVLVESDQLDAVDMIYQVRQMEFNVGLFVIAQENRLDDLVQAIGTGIGDYLLRPLEGRELFPSKLKKLIARRDRHLRYSRLLSELKALNLDLQKVLP